GGPRRARATPPWNRRTTKRPKEPSDLRAIRLPQSKPWSQLVDASTDWFATGGSRAPSGKTKTTGAAPEPDTGLSTTFENWRPISRCRPQTIHEPAAYGATGAAGSWYRTTYRSCAVCSVR